MTKGFLPCSLGMFWKALHPFALICFRRTHCWNKLVLVEAVGQVHSTNNPLRSCFIKGLLIWCFAWRHKGPFFSTKSTCHDVLYYWLGLVMKHVLPMLFPKRFVELVTVFPVMQLSNNTGRIYFANHPACHFLRIQYHLSAPCRISQMSYTTVS